MFDFFKKKSPAAAPAVPAAAGDAAGAGVPAPLAGRDGHVGAIEALTLDGTMYFFGFDFRSDLVLSPLMSDPVLMARFASRHMAQRDGTHDKAYWAALVGFAREGSELCSNDDGRSFDSRMLAATLARLAHVRREGTPEPGFTVEYHLRYLLGAAGGWEVPEEAGSEDADLWISQIAGEAPLADGMPLQEVAARLQLHLNALVDAAPGNWATLFAVLKS
ncbi:MULTISPECIES: hypothetical protein [unclassified Variovorax]|uniref:hypothetical protein n=1 Tax=unclassified Variovorax TaxID=663243 RepID=UPI0008B5BC38|nr:MULTISPECIES: hypothetical protein [unclassified Variovorax]SEK06204.1 hypothetical protein SAMN05518853_107121 [Variovorax sp. OK202]SFD45482.1 hypothetical protein SAMN05444746_107121 [Variovorax sp. OK212]